MTVKVGHTVIYTQAKHEHPHNGSNEHPAIVTRVWNDHMVNLQVLADFGPVYAAGSVKHETEADEGAPCWREVD